jgi:hypothetical protein
LALRKTKSRLIEVDGQPYRWTFSDVGDAYGITVQSADGVGQKLAVHLPLRHDAPVPVVTPVLVAQAIKFGIGSGWTPTAAGAVIHLSCQRDCFTRTV